METLFVIILASFIVSLISFSGAIIFIVKESKVKKTMILFVALAAGSLLGTAFFHLIPESIELFGTGSNSQGFLPSYFILFGILLFYIIEKFIHWHHHHDLDCHKHSLSTLSLVGDAFHNFIDGALIAAAFLVDFKVGLVTTLAIILHEIPQEIGDLAILLHSGMSKVKALTFNFLSALTSLLGALIMFSFGQGINDSLPLLLAFVAGGFIYISLADIIPELNTKKHPFSQHVISFVFLLGIILSYSLTLLGH